MSSIRPKRHAGVLRGGRNVSPPDGRSPGVLVFALLRLRALQAPDLPAGAAQCRVQLWILGRRAVGRSAMNALTSKVKEYRACGTAGERPAGDRCSTVRAKTYRRCPRVRPQNQSLMYQTTGPTLELPENCVSTLVMGRPIDRIPGFPG